MRKPGTDESNVQMSDVLCDFCRREWVDDLPMIEGHQGSCICGRCLTVAYTEIVLNSQSTAPADFKCRMCLETLDDREATDRGGETGWQSPAEPDACVCRRCIKLAAGALSKDKEMGWKRPV